MEVRRTAGICQIFNEVIATLMHVDANYESRNLCLNLVQADCGEKSSGSRRKSHAKPVIVKIYSAETGDLAPQDAAYDAIRGSLIYTF